MNIQSLIEQARTDPSLLNTINVEALLASNQNIHCLEGQTLESIATSIYDALCSIPHIQPKQIQTFCSKLLEYRYIDEIYQLHRGKHIRWIRIHNPEIECAEHILLANGAVVMDTKFFDNGVHVVCRSPRTGRFFQIKWDECIIFQKLNEEERLILFLNASS